MFRTSSVHHQERFVQAVFADFGICCNTRTTRHVQPLQSCRTTCVLQDDTMSSFRIHFRTQIPTQGQCVQITNKTMNSLTPVTCLPLY